MGGIDEDSHSLPYGQSTRVTDIYVSYSGELVSNTTDQIHQNQIGKTN